ncbi:hypothetical protein [Flavisolibacter ginsenosidimutans]|uniref:Uncharacterized protein n=1 Tax=Flavisolibacter ginsenosidimutans TaxID=661481 RepID=A0A5B8UJK7_9BACT|nr:hypothetical protein [Flavisolibacter ginsenosidimutans]QEC56877.1 hypothetical protein FSB75_13555 [Flavisolibacter ginsenosidimutans]
MNEEEKAVFFFEYLEDFRRTGGLYFQVPDDESTVLFYRNIEGFKHTLEQEEIKLQTAKVVFKQLSIQIFRAYYEETHNTKFPAERLPTNYREITIRNA